MKKYIRIEDTRAKDWSIYEYRKDTKLFHRIHATTKYWSETLFLPSDGLNCLGERYNSITSDNLEDFILDVL